MGEGAALPAAGSRLRSGRRDAVGRRLGVLPLEEGADALLARRLRAFELPPHPATVPASRLDPPLPRWEPPPVVAGAAAGVGAVDEAVAQPDLPDGSFEVAALLAVRTRKRKRQFLVAWKGYGLRDVSWEPEDNFASIDAVLQDCVLSTSARGDVSADPALARRVAACRNDFTHE